MTENPVQFWSWLVQLVGPIGATLILIIAVIVTLSAFITPLYVHRLRRQINRFEHQLADVTAAQSRQNQVERLQRDRERPRPRKR